MPPDTHSPFPETHCNLAENSGGIYFAPLCGGLCSLSANALPRESAGALLERLEDAAASRGLEAVQANVFCDPAIGNAYREMHGVRFPIAWLAHHDTPAGSVLSARITALPVGDFKRVTGAHNSPVGASWETDDARYLLLGALTPSETHLPRDRQSAALWSTLKNELEKNNFTLRHLARTWYFNDHILDWYADFNRVRNAFFTENNVFGTLVPASTGVGASNAAGAALSLDAIAIAPKNAIAAETLALTAVASPLQCAAYDYKSAFSRAVECAAPDGSRHLFISGTASIEPGGKTVHQNDLDAQIDLSLRVVAAILESRGMNWNDTARAILYFPKIEWMCRWETRRAALGLPELPAIFAHCDICRDDLLFEIELDAWKEGA